MGHSKSEKSLIRQVQEKLDSKLAIGESKYVAKRKNTHTEKIYSWSTYFFDNLTRDYDDK